MPSLRQQVISLNNNINDYYFRIEDIELKYMGKLCIGSGGFFSQAIIYFNKAILETFHKNLISMYETLKGEAIIHEHYEDTFVKVSINQLGHVTVSGEASSHKNDCSQYLEFEFITDQTELPNLIKSTKSFLDFIS